jgi:outer membrane murein-binding lipoprotein Lpp
MTTLKKFAILVALLAGGTSLAKAQDGASDTVTLSAAQQSAVWTDLSKQAINQNAAGFDATIGTFMPDIVEIEPIPGDVTANNPSLNPYYFAMVDHKLVIVDPSNRVIAGVLTTIDQQLGHERPAIGQRRVASARTKRLILSSQSSPWGW